jgi:hypothetical protein
MSDQTDFILASLRVASLRVRIIAGEIDACGVALKGGFISPEVALAWCEDVAPGCLGYMPPAIKPALARDAA